MDKFLINQRFSSPIITGTPIDISATEKSTQTHETDATSFKKIFQEQLNSMSEINFSKHAATRVLERNVEVSEENLARLNEGVRLAEEKGLNEPLIIVDTAAYIVNIGNNTVITAVSDEDLKGNVFTNIDGTVII